MMSSSKSLLLCAVMAHIASCSENSTDGRPMRQTNFSPYIQTSGLYKSWLPNYLLNSLHQSYNPYFDEPRSLFPMDLLHGHTLYGPWAFKATSDESSASTFRQNLFGLSNINNAINPFANFFSRLPDTLIRNPNSVSSLTKNYEGCTDSSGLSGICVLPWVCRGFGGRTADSCGLGTVCCINTLVKCGGQVTVNNTYWQSPLVLGAATTCGMTLTLDNNLLEQSRKICQVRLDLISFSIAQPSSKTLCLTDTFQVAGANNKVPIICGDNNGQHMYLDAPSPVTNMQLLFTFGATSVSRTWNIKITLLPCGASYLAPVDCLQYFTESSGTVSSFNWKDTSGTAARQLAYQDYRVCFRTEQLSDSNANKICFTPCTITNDGQAFSLSGQDTKPEALANCGSDYLIVPGGYDSSSSSYFADRYCGGAFNPSDTASTSTTVCTTVKPFSLIYRTNGDESDATEDGGQSTGTGNIGFCFNFQQNSS